MKSTSECLIWCELATAYASTGVSIICNHMQLEDSADVLCGCKYESCTDT